MTWTNGAFWIAAQSGILTYGEAVCGVSKTAQGASAARYLGVDFIKIKLDGKSPDDFEIPSLVEIQLNGEKLPAIRSVLDEVLLKARHQPSLLMFDELPQASHQVLGYVQEDWFNQIPEGSMAIATGNPLDRSTSGQPLPQAVVNRACILKWEFDNDQWLEGMGNCFQYPEPSFPILPDNWLQHFCPKWGVLIRQFMETRPDLMDWDDQAPDGDQVAANDGIVRPYGSPRSWENFAKAAGAAESVGAGKAIFSKLARGIVGPVGEEFLVWLVQQNLPDPKAILANPRSLVLPKRFDLARAIIRGVLGAVKADGTPQMWESGLDVLEVIWPQSREVAISAEKAFWMCKPFDYTPNPRVGTWDEIVEAANARSKSVVAGQ